MPVFLEIEISDEAVSLLDSIARVDGEKFRLPMGAEDIARDWIEWQAKAIIQQFTTE